VDIICFREKRTAVLIGALIMTAGLVSGTARTPLVGSSQNRIRILRVERVLDSGVAASWDAGLVISRLTKFADATASSPCEIFSVYWEPTGVAPAGVLVTFEYLQECSRQVQFFFKKYEWPVEREEKAVFVVNVGGARPAGRVTAWRARVVYRGRLLAGTQSETWK
jgi:hypothetical protein